MTRRSAASTFAPDAFVFPGGTVDRQDTAPPAQAQTLGLGDPDLKREFRASEAPALPSGVAPIEDGDRSALLLAGLRELFEEAGVLIARTAAGSPVDAGVVASEAVQAERARVRSGDLAFARMLEARDWFADARALALFSHWITPPSEPRRYNTHFFFAIAPLDQAARADAVETHDGIWIDPAAALARYRDGRMHLVYPTIKHLERLVRFDSAESVLAFARRKPILTIVPTTTPGDDFEMPPALEGTW